MIVKFWLMIIFFLSGFLQALDSKDSVTYITSTRYEGEVRKIAVFGPNVVLEKINDPLLAEMIKDIAVCFTQETREAVEREAKAGEEKEKASFWSFLKKSFGV